MRRRNPSGTSAIGTGRNIGNIGFPSHANSFV
jgi:hypothetical protein